MNADLLGDSSWDTALGVVRAGLVPPGDVVRLVRNAWTGTTTLREFTISLHLALIPSTAIIEASQLIEPSSTTLNTAISSLGFKGAATVAAIRYTCGTLSSQSASERINSLVMQSIIDSIEIGYHFGLSAESIGPEAGILLGFSQSIGAALLILSTDVGVSEAKAILEREHTADSCREQFGCEPYQVASLALQRLGFGPSVASAAVMALGNTKLELFPADPTLRAWSAASEWINAFSRGARAPRRKSSLLLFPDLLRPENPDMPIPLHLEALLEGINSVRTAHSTWTWHTSGTSSTTSQLAQPSLQ